MPKSQLCSSRSESRSVTISQHAATVLSGGGASSGMSTSDNGTEVNAIQDAAREMFQEASIDWANEFKDQHIELCFRNYYYDCTYWCMDRCHHHHVSVHIQNQTCRLSKNLIRYYVWTVLVQSTLLELVPGNYVTAITQYAGILPWFICTHRMQSSMIKSIKRPPGHEVFVSILMGWYFMSATVMSNIVEDSWTNFTLLRFGMIMLYILTLYLMMCVTYKAWFYTSWFIITTVIVMSAYYNDLFNAFVGTGVGYASFLILITFAFTYVPRVVMVTNRFAFKSLDKSHRIEFMMMSKMSIDNRKLQKRLTTLELVNTGKLKLDGEMKEYVLSFASASKPNNEESRSPNHSALVAPHGNGRAGSGSGSRSPLRNSITILPRRPSVRIRSAYASSTTRDRTEIDLPYARHSDTNIHASSPPSLPGSTVDVKSLDLFDYHSKQSVMELVGMMYSLDFCSLLLHRVEPSHVLYVVVMEVCAHFDLFKRVPVDKKSVGRYIAALESDYSTPTSQFHIAAHAADACLTLTYMLDNTPELCESLQPVDVFACVIAAAAHDYHHLGCNNTLLIKTSHTLAMVYNDKSVLENNHASSALTLMTSSFPEVMAGWTTETKARFRKTVIELILGTDMGQHFNLVKGFNALLDRPVDYNDDDDRITVLRYAMKLADVSHVLKRLQDTIEWTDKITAEFYSQGDREKQLGLSVSPFMDRGSGNVPKSQLGFIDYVLLPLVTSWSEFSGDHEYVDRLSATREYWQHQSNLLSMGK